MAASLPSLPDVERLSTNIVRVLGGNPGKYTLQGSNTYILGAGPQRILLDTGQGVPAWKANLSTALQQYNTTISLCLLSHWHHDHLGGVADLISLSSSSTSSTPTIHKNQPSLNPDNLIDPSTTLDISDGQKFSTAEGFELTALHAPGHAADHMCFLITASSDPSEIGSIFTADNVLGHGTAVFEDLPAYVSSLSLMHRTLVANAAATGDSARTVKAYPGHGQVIDDAAAKIQEYIEHRRQREEEVLNLLRYGTTKAPPPPQTSEAAGGTVQDGTEGSPKEWGSMDLVKVIYQNYPESLHIPAEGGVKQVLGKLLKEGRVVYNNQTSKWQFVSARATL
ncbi:hypothetical protein DV735_g4270, partial [Chaetothyriales sp. CBS 134920]